MNPGAERLLHWVVKASESKQGEPPIFPYVASRLVTLLERSDADLQEVEAVIAQDPVVMAHLLRTANSALYSGAVPVESVGQAVMRIGLRETANVAMAAACRCLFSVEDRAELDVYPALWRALWHDSLLCAYGGRLLARELGRGDAERVFLGAMFRNIGCLLVLKIVARGCVHGALHSLPSEDDLRYVLRELHPELGAVYLERSHLPEDAVAAARHHHAPLLHFTPETLDLHIVRLADGLSESIGVAPFAAGALTMIGERSLELLEVSAEQHEVFELHFRSLAEQLEDLL